MTVSVRLSDEDKALFKSYARIKKVSLSELFRSAVMEQIEDEYDLHEFERAKSKFDADPVTYTHEEVKRELGL